MSLEIKINDDLKKALKNKEILKVSTLRLLKSSFQYYLLDQNKRALSEQDIITIIGKQVKQRKDSIDNYEKGGREDLKDKEMKELHILESYLPTQLSDEELTELIKEAIKQDNISSKKEMGKVIKIVLEKAKGTADGKRVSAIVSQILTA